MNGYEPIAKHYLDIFAAKVGFALYYETTGSIVPPEGGVRGMWSPNLEIRSKGVPPEMRVLFPEEGSTLSQGAIKVSDQFEYYSHVHNAEVILGSYMVRLIDGLAIFTFATSQIEVLLAYRLGRKIFRPGDFKLPPKT